MPAEPTPAQAEARRGMAALIRLLPELPTTQQPRPYVEQSVAEALNRKRAERAANRKERRAKA